VVVSITHAGLRSWAKGLYPLEAAVEILVRAFGGRFAAPGHPWIQPCDQPGWWWLDVTMLVDDQIGHLSGGEQRVLRFVASLAGGAPVSLADNLPGLDRELIDLVLAGLAHANGSHEHPDLRIDRARGVAVLNGRLPSLHPWPGAVQPGSADASRATDVTNAFREHVPSNPDWRQQLSDLPMIREDLLVQLERRASEGATPAELDELRRDYHELFGRF
jgi:hypothetical protein